MAEEATVVRVGPRVVPCEAYGPVSIQLDDLLTAGGRLDLNPEIESGDYFAVSLKRGTLTLRAGGHVGFIPLNDRIVVQVVPRVPMSNLNRVVALSGLPPTILTSIRGYETLVDWNDALLDVYAEQLIRHIETIAISGLIREYTRREDVSSFPRGRISLHETIRRQNARGIRHRAEFSWFERTPDLPANQCLKYATWLLARRYAAGTSPGKHQRGLLRRLNGLFSIFEGVKLDHNRRFLSDAIVSGAKPLPTLRSYYRDALSVAKAVIEQRAVLIDSGTGPVRLPSIVMNMNYVFESYIRTVLQLHAAANNWPEEVLDGNQAPGRKPLFNPPSSEPPATPDIALRAPDSSWPLVLEVKNVPIKDAMSERGHINQAVTYAVSYRAKRVVLVHPRKSRYQLAGLRLQGVVDDIKVYLYCFDLGADDLEVEEQAFGAAVESLVLKRIAAPSHD